MTNNVLNTIEHRLWKIRYLIMFPIIFLIIALIYLIILMGMRVVDATQALFVNNTPFDVLILLIDIVDFTLIAVIMLIIIWGVYELFVRGMSMNIHQQMKADQILIHDIDELKQKLGKVVIVSLVVHMFKQLLVADIQTSMDMMLTAVAVVALAVAVVALAVALFLMEKLGKSSTHQHHVDQLHHEIEEHQEE